MGGARRAAAALPAAPLLALAACSGAGTAASSAAPTTSAAAGPAPSATGPAPSSPAAAAGGSALAPCDVTEPAVVASVFGGTAQGEQPGSARNCTYRLSGGTVPQVEVFSYGPADQWDGVRGGYVANRGGVTDVTGIGDAAFRTKDAVAEVVVRTARGIFSVALVPRPRDAAVVARLDDLARRIATTG